jgi:hypothetical protein
MSKLVELLDELCIAFPVPGDGHRIRLTDILLQPNHFGDVAAAREQSDRSSFEELLHLEEFDDLPPRRRRHEGAHPWPDLHEPFGLQLLEGFADRGAADPELLGQRDLGEVLARDEFSADDPPPHLSDDAGA